MKVGGGSPVLSSQVRVIDVPLTLIWVSLGEISGAGWAAGNRIGTEKERGVRRWTTVRKSGEGSIC